MFEGYEPMKLNLKSLSVACALSTTALVGCSSFADLKNNTPPAPANAPTLQSHHWQLQQALNAQGSADIGQWQLPATASSPARTVGLRFSKDQIVSVDRMCNLISGGYRTQGDQMHVERMTSTMMACGNADLMQLEKNVARQLPSVSNWKITNNASPLLELRFKNGTTWQLEGKPTHETLYGRSEQIFLEVAPQKVTCSHPLIPNAQCLQVRELKYNEQGIKQSMGTWQNYYGTIEGYTHQAGVRNVLRIKRFTREHVPADASKYVDVLDMAVESEIVR